MAHDPREGRFLPRFTVGPVRDGVWWLDRRGVGVDGNEVVGPFKSLDAAQEAANWHNDLNRRMENGERIDWRDECRPASAAGKDEGDG